MLRRIILTRITGQLGNRLLVGAHVLAAAVECGADCLNPAFLEYSDWFEGPRRCLATWRLGATERPPYSRRLRTCVYVAIRVAWEAVKILGPLSFGRIAREIGPARQPRDLKEVVDRAQAGGATTLFLQGFYFRNDSWAERHAATLRDFFMPCIEHRVVAEKVVHDLRQSCEIVVAVHLRHGDYKTFQGGKYFYEVPIYRAFIERMRNLLGYARVGFLICSNANLKADDFNGLIWRLGPGSVPGDLYAMACCDYVLGPPSTFSSWAAFQGNTKLLHIEHRDRDFTLEDFVVKRAP